MKSKFGKIWRLTMAMALVVMLLPVLAVGAPVGAVVNNNNNGDCCDPTVVTVCPAIVACESGGSEDKEFTVENNGSCNIHRVEFSVPAAYTLLHAGLTVDMPLNWNLDVTVSGGEVLVLKFWTDSNPILTGGNFKQFKVYAVGIPVGSSGVYWWDWEAWDTSHKGCQPPNDECPGAEDAKCSGSAKQSVDCEWPVIVSECLGIDCDCEVLADVGHIITATITDPEGNLDFDSVKLWGGECASECVEPCDDEECASSGDCCDTSYHSRVPDRSTPITNGAVFEWDVHSWSDCTDVCYYIQASDLAEPAHTSYWPDCDDVPSTQDGCCYLHADGQAPDLNISVDVPKPDCYECGATVNITVENTDETVVGIPEVKVNGSTAGVTYVGDTTYEYTYVADANCDHAVDVTAVDCVGNEGSDDTSFYVDCLAPDCPTIGGEACPLENRLWWSEVSDNGNHCYGDITYKLYVTPEGESEQWLRDFTEAERPTAVDPYPHTGLEDGKEYCYRVEAVDEWGNANSCGSICLVFTVDLPTEEWVIDDLCMGWNLISLPKVPQNPAITSVMDGVLNDYDSGSEVGEAVWAYDPEQEENNGWSWKVVLSDLSLDGPLDTMVDGKGYWFYNLTPDVTITVVGWDMAVGGGQTPPLYQVSSGWNLIGFKSQEEMCAVEYLWRLLVADAAGYATFEMGYSVFEEWWLAVGEAHWFAYVESVNGSVDDGELMLHWWITEGNGAFSAEVWQYNEAMWLKVRAGLTLQYENLLMMLFGYDCECNDITYVPATTMEPGDGYWLYADKGGEILPVGMQYIWFLQLFGMGGIDCIGGGCD